MTKIEELVGALSDRLLAVEHQKFADMEAVVARSWSLADRAAMKRWRRGRHQARVPVVAGLVADASVCGVLLVREAETLFADAMDLTWASLVNEMKLVEGALGSQYLGVANVGLNRVEKAGYEVAARTDFADVVQTAVGLYAGALTAVVEAGVRSQLVWAEVSAQIAPLWGAVAATVKAEVRRAEFEMVNAVRTDVIDMVDQAAEAR